MALSAPDATVSPSAAPVAAPAPARAVVADVGAARALLMPQEGFAGNARTGGYGGQDTRPDDYVVELADPIRRMEVFEEMRGSDESINAAISTRVALGCQSNWVLASEDTTPLGREILEFCEDNLYPQLERLLPWLLGGAVHYGFGLVEPVYGWADEAPANHIRYGKVSRAVKSSGRRRIYLHRCVEIRQRTVETFCVRERGQLDTIRQSVYTGTRFSRHEIDARKVLLHVYDQHGDDYWGTPPTRYAYRLWKFKQQLEKLNLLAAERHGVGVPVIVAGEGWTAEDYALAEKYARGMRSGAHQFLVLPNGGTISILSGDGASTSSMLEWTKFYAVGMAKTWLTQGGDLAFNSDTGARALGEELYEQSGGVVQADVEAVAQLLNDRLLVPLVRANYGRQAAYPALVPSQRVRQSSAIGNLVQQLAASNFVHATPQDEVWIRDMIGMPSVSLDALMQPTSQQFNPQDAYPIGAIRTAGLIKWSAEDEAWLRESMRLPQIDVGQRQAEMDEARETLPAPGAPGAGGPPQFGRPAAAASRASAFSWYPLATGGPTGDALPSGRLQQLPEPAVPGKSTHRTEAYHRWEAQRVKPELLATALSTETARGAAEVLAVLRDIDAALAEQVSALALQGAAALSLGAASITAPAALRQRLELVLLTAAARAREAGASSVQLEVSRQMEPDVAAPDRGVYGGTMAPDSYGSNAWSGRSRGRFARMLTHLRAAIAVFAAGDELTEPADARELRVVGEVQRVVAEEVGRREASARSAALAALAVASTVAAAELAQVARARAAGALEELSTGRTSSNVDAVTNVSFGVGRDDGAERVTAIAGAPELVGYVYSAVLDEGTCDECAKWDGAFFPAGYDEAAPESVKCPNPRCSGGYNRCRCLKVFVTAAEAPKVVGPSSGPQPMPIRDEFGMPVVAPPGGR